MLIVDRVSFEEILLVPQISTLARVGGAALTATNERYRDNPQKVYEALGSGTGPGRHLPSLLARELCAHGVDVSGQLFLRAPRPSRVLESEARLLVDDSCNRSASDTFVVEWALTDASSEAAAAPDRRKDVLADVGRRLTQEIRGSDNRRTLVIVVSPTASTDMTRRGDEVTPVVLAVGRPDRLLQPSGPMRALRSNTTRQTGLVANVDVAPTILDFFGIPIPSEMDGQPIEITDEPAPFKLHRLHLEQRRIRLPIQLAEVAYISAAGAAAIVMLLLAARRRSLSPRLARSMEFVALSGAALPTPLILGGVLPRLTYWVVVPFIVISVAGLAALARAVPWPGPLGPFTFLGVVGLAAVVVDALFGWRGARIPLLGGTMFDGARFYGLPNSFIGLLLASALFVAAALPAFSGFLLLVAAGLFAGFPSLGADIGGAATLLLAAGLWWVLRTRPRIRVNEVVLVAGVVVLGLAAVLLANRYLPGAPTHATRFVERSGNGPGGFVHTYLSRLSVGFRQLRDAPPAWIPVLGLPIVLGFVLARPGPIGGGLDLAGRRWTHALVVLTVAGVVAFFVNDTGVAAAGPVFLYAMSGMAYPAFVAVSRSASDGDPAVKTEAEAKA